MVKKRNLSPFQLTLRRSCVDQSFHESTPRRIIVDFSLTINTLTKIDRRPIDQKEDVIKHSNHQSGICQRESGRRGHDGHLASLLQDDMSEWFSQGRRVTSVWDTTS
ncbi:hypothetical protein NPIL_655651 [Nephila pilipes]|uniref:Uncharacterized protein n=1 Tax=Nephila pilipes TaxID=299642 RepID=A0A8X6K7D9_NEPPI|nr:hypothetical protein NPIL_655651 [Nephila pilipes]